MKYFNGRPVLSDCNDLVDVGWRPKGNENWDTRHLSVWMDKYEFVAVLAQWQIDNRDLTEEEIFGAVLAWDLTHVNEEAITKSLIRQMEVTSEALKADRS